ncbi:MAG: cryptochrome/photolyase family protein [Solirubrobacteraceae bacterium]
MTALVWLRRDLRVHDHPALHVAHQRDELVIPVFCFDDRLLHGRHASGARTQFLLESLSDLDMSLRGRGGGLVIRHGDPVNELVALAERTGARIVHASVDAGPFARRRDRHAVRRLREAGIELCGHPGTFVTDDLASLQTGGGGSYTVFTPFHRAWLKAPRREFHRAPRHLPPLPSDLDPGAIRSLAKLRLDQPLGNPAPGGESAARAAVTAFLRGTVERYAESRDDLGHDGTSRLSPYLHFGCMSARELEQRVVDRGGAGPAAFRRQLRWRDFYAHVLRAHPDDAGREHQERYRGTLSWTDDRERFDAWRDGRTGYPLVDAAMRQLATEGWMHNRARLVVGSFLTKDLGIDWRWGERHFMRLLLDGDQASNNGNWQWIASVGVDPQPVFRRIFNPRRQQERFDADGRYVRRHVPELRDVPDEHLAEPRRMPVEVQTAIRCRIGVDYPEPIVDHATTRREALQRYGEARGRGR